MTKPKILIVGHGRHGKDEFAEMLCLFNDLTCKSSSLAAAEIFIFDELSESRGYKTVTECHNDRLNHRSLWKQMIDEYNSVDKTRLAKDIMKDNDIYVGLRSYDEVIACINDNIFDLIIGVYRPGTEHEPESSFDHAILDLVDILVLNDQGLDAWHIKAEAFNIQEAVRIAKLKRSPRKWTP
jgi:hypothetical protein